MENSRESGRSWSRRRLIAVGAAASATLLAPAGVVASPDRRDPPARERSLSFVHIHTGERLKSFYWADGDYIEESLYEIDWILRDFRTGDIFHYDVRLLNLLHRLRNEMESDAAYHVISGYRSPKTNAMLLDRVAACARKACT